MYLIFLVLAVVGLAAERLALSGTLGQLATRRKGLARIRTLLAAYRFAGSASSRRGTLLTGWGRSTTSLSHFIISKKKKKYF